MGAVLMFAWMVWTTTVDPADDVLRWDPVANGARYEVNWEWRGTNSGVWENVGQVVELTPPAAFDGTVCVRACNSLDVCSDAVCGDWAYNIGRRLEWDSPACSMNDNTMPCKIGDVR